MMQTGVQNKFAFKLVYLDCLWRFPGSTDLIGLLDLRAPLSEMFLHNWPVQTCST